MLHFLRNASAAACALLLASSASAQLIGSGHVMGNGTGSAHAPTDTPLIQIMNQAGSGIGAGVPTVLGVAPNVSGGVATIGAAPVNGYCAQFNSGGSVVPAGGPCTVSGGGGTVTSGTKGQPAYYPSTGATVAGAPATIYTASTTMANVLTDCGSSGTCILTAGVSLGANATCPAGLTLSIPNGIEITQSAAYTLTFSCALQAQPTQIIFSGFTPGQISFASSSTPLIWAEWWGAAPAASGVTNQNAFQSAVIAGECGPGVRYGFGVFPITGLGSVAYNNGGAINIIYENNTSGCMINFRGQGPWLSTLQLTAGSDFNIIQIGEGVNTIRTLPFDLEDMTLDGNGAVNPQQSEGDEYQDGLNVLIASGGGPGGPGIIVRNVELKNNSYHGASFNTAQYVHAQFYTHDNYSSGAIMGVNPTASLYQHDNYFDITATDNGRTDGSHNYDCNDMGAYIGVGYNDEVHIRTTGHTSNPSSCTDTSPSIPGGVTLSRMSNSTFFINSQADYMGVRVDYGNFDKIINITANAEVSNCLEDVNGTSNATTGNVFIVNLSNCGASAMSLGTTYSFQYNTFTGVIVNTTNSSGSPVPLISIGPGFSGNRFSNLIIGDQHGSSNMSYFVSGASGGQNSFMNIFGVGHNFTSGIEFGLTSNDVAGFIGGTASGMCGSSLTIAAGC